MERARPSSWEAGVPAATGLLVPSVVWPIAVLVWIGDTNEHAMVSAMRFPLVALACTGVLMCFVRGVRPTATESRVLLALRAGLLWGFLTVFWRAMLEGFGAVSFGYDDVRNYGWIWHQPLVLGIGIAIAVIAAILVDAWWWRN
jgi:hypothetical protein